MKVDHRGCAISGWRRCRSGGSLWRYYIKAHKIAAIAVTGPRKLL
ncbi:hypothetical protein CupriaWKF_22220 [Cupriavidus sp. WKF15]|nr:hypothetical protein [Cupriavidus sp. WKF15]WER49841.1 hypothetical protein CupriaWKF_22220 [Cupriavidus sp. WKF15]